MKGYLTIGAVSKKKGVSIKSLRYYDRIGVLRPAYINEMTNYRYYTEEQLYILDAISLCIELGIPLRDFEKYTDGQGNFNLQNLLYDGKLLAEQKIMDIRKRLGTVQAALQALNYKPVPLHSDSLQASGQDEPLRTARQRGDAPVPAASDVSPLPDAVPSAPAAVDTPVSQAVTMSTDAAESPAPAHTEIHDEKAGFYERYIPARAVLTTPFTEEDTENYSQKILRLFMLAQLLGMTANYPSGILYDYNENGEAEKFIFVHVENHEDCADKRLHILPAGTYSCSQGTRHRITDSDHLREIFQLTGKPYLVVESDLIDDKIRKGDNSLELQIIQN